jgi:hypothetical protein
VLLIGVGDDMKFLYSSKHYLIGLILLLFVFVAGVVTVWEALFKLPILFFSYPIFCFAMLREYLKSYFAYRDRYVYLYHEGIIFGDRNQVVGLERNEIEMIIEARHHQKIKIHRVIHVFLKDGRYVYFTTDIAKYKEFKEALESLYPQCFYQRKHLFPAGYLLTKENLMNEEI